MIESGVVRYGKEFTEAMERGEWDLSKVDYSEVAKSQATLVYGQMNEPPGARSSVALSGLSIAESLEMLAQKRAKHQTFCSLSTIFSVLLRQVPKCLLCSDVCLRLWATNLRWQVKWVPCKSVLLRQRMALLHQYKLYTYLPMT